MWCRGTWFWERKPISKNGSSTGSRCLETRGPHFCMPMSRLGDVTGLLQDIVEGWGFEGNTSQCSFNMGQMVQFGPHDQLVKGSFVGGSAICLQIGVETREIISSHIEPCISCTFPPRTTWPWRFREYSGRPIRRLAWVKQCIRKLWVPMNAKAFPMI